MRKRDATTQPVSIVVPTYRREGVLVETIRRLLALEPKAAEIIVVDQTPAHAESVEKALSDLDGSGEIRWRRLSRPSIPHAMNVGLQVASHEIVVFVDDDVIPDADLVRAHREAYDREACGVVAGRVLQPWDDSEVPGSGGKASLFSGTTAGPAEEFIGCNFSVRRATALRLRGFDENFVGAAYRYEAEFAFRARGAGERIFFEPRALVRHLKAGEGGIRAHGDFLTTASPVHSVGAYYLALRTRRAAERVRAVMKRLGSSVRTRHHLRRPWWIPVTLAAELLGLLWAVRLSRRGPILLGGVR